MARRNSAPEREAHFQSSIDNGSRTTRPRYTSVHPIARGKPGRTRLPTRCTSAPSLIDAVERTPVGEVDTLGLLPTAEGAVDRDHAQGGEARRVLCEHLRRTRSIAVASDDLLTLFGVQELEVGLSRSARAASI